MALDATQELCTTTPTAVVDLRFYGGPDWADLDPADYTLRALPVGWTDADTPAVGWTEITERVKWDGSLTLERDGSAVHAAMSLRGIDYDVAYLGLDKAIVVLDRITVNGVVKYDWGLYFRGIVTAGEHADDYRHGGPWDRELQGLQAPLRLANAPRITAGPVDIAYGKSVSATSTLADPASEAGSGEFLGVSVNLDPDNVTDANLNTVWISQTAPDPTGETAVEDYWGGIDKVFFKPATGYTGFWWFEVFNANAEDGQTLTHLAFQNEDNVWLDLYIHPNNPVPGFETGGYTLGPKERGIVTSDRALFEALTGGARKAKWIVEAKSWPLRGHSENPRIYALDGVAFTLDNSAGLIRMYSNPTFGRSDVVAWNQTGAVVPGLAGWTGGAIDVSGLAVGQGIRRYPSGTDTNTAADWVVDEYPEPGDIMQPGQIEALLLNLGAHETQLSLAYTHGEDVLTLSDTSAFPVRPGGATNEGVIGLETFTYTGRTTTTLTGVSAMTEDYPIGEAVYPYVDGVAMTGWPVSEITLIRRDGLDSSGNPLPVLDTFRVYIRKTGDDAPDIPTVDDPEITAWRADWDTHYFAGKGNAQRIVTFRPMGANDQGFRWMRWLMVYVMKMSDGGRAKLNEMHVMLAQTEVGGSGLGDIDGATSGALAKYLLEEHYELPAGGFADETVPTVHGLLGSHATAIAPYSTVLEDLARVTGCVARHNRAGGLTWRLDPWWPTGAGTLHLSPTAILGAEHVRGEVRYRAQKPSIVGVVVRARSVDGMEQYTAMWPLGADILGPVREYTDYVVSSEADAQWLAQALWAREGLNYAYTKAPQEAFLTIKGVGEWCGVDQWIDLATDDATGQIAPVNCDYLLRDQFTTDRSAGDVDGTAAEPGPGLRDVTDTESKLTIATGALTFAGGKASPANGDPGILYPSIARTAGRVLVATVNYSNFGTQSFIGWSASGTGGNFFRQVTSGSLNVRDGASGTDVAVGVMAASTDYQLAVVLRGAGAFYLIKGGAYTEWTLLWAAGLYTSATLLPAILNYNAVFTADDVEVPDETYLPTPAAYDTFTRANGAIGTSETTGPDGQTVAAREWTGDTWTIAGNVAVNTPTGPTEYCASHDSSAVDVMVGAKLATYAAGQAGVAAQLDAAHRNGVVLYQDGANVKFDKLESGSLTNIATYASAYATGDRLALWLSGSAFRVYKVNAAGVPVLLGSGTTTVLSGQRHGLFSTHSGNTFDNYNCWPVGTAGEYAALNDVGKLGYTGTSSWLTERVTQEFRTVDRQRSWTTRLNLRRFIR